MSRENGNRSYNKRLERSWGKQERFYSDCLKARRIQQGRREEVILALFFKESNTLYHRLLIFPLESDEIICGNRGDGASSLSFSLLFSTGSEL